MMQSSAMSAKVKMNTLTQEVIRRLRNTRVTLPWEDYQAPILTKFSKKMARSGYHQGYREEVIKSGVLGFERQLAASRSGEKPLFRPRDWQMAERRRRKMVRKAAWYRPADCMHWLLSSFTKRRTGKRDRQGADGGGEEDKLQPESSQDWGAQYRKTAGQT